ncbi:MAG: zf-HC2 domain-containing protein [Acidobacteriota bacterium]
MTRIWHKSLLKQTWHPSEEELVLYLDGEMNAAANHRMETHLRRCWGCRVKRTRMDRFVSDFMEVRRFSLGSSGNSPSGALLRLDARLDRLDSEDGVLPFRRRLIDSLGLTHGLRRLSVRWVAFVVASFFMLLILLRLSSAPPVSAEEVLFRVGQAEAQRMHAVPAPVIYEKLEVRRRSASGHLDTVTWEVWNDTTKKRLRHRVKDSGGLRFLPEKGNTSSTALRSSGGKERAVGLPVSSRHPKTPIPPILDELEHVFRTYRADFGQPLSPRNYEAWRDSIGDKFEEVHRGDLPNGDRSIILRASGRGPFLPDSVVRAEFTVRQKDWRPVAQRLQVQKEDGIVDYELGEIAFDLITLGRLPPSIFADSSVRTIARVPVPLLETFQADARSSSSEADLLAAEVEAWYGLHSVRACIGRPILVTRVGLNQIEVEGVVETDGRKAEILAALEGIQHVTPKVRTTEEDLVVSSSLANTLPPDEKTQTDAEVVSSSPQLGLTGVPTERLVIEDLLEQYFVASGTTAPGQENNAGSVQSQIAEFARETISTSVYALEEAWALRRLVESQPALDGNELPAASRRLLAVMAQDHLTALEEELNQLRVRLEPVLCALVTDKGASSETGRANPVVTPIVGNSRWTTDFARFFASVEESAGVALELFAEGDMPANQRDAAIRALLSTFSAFPGEIQRLQAQVRRGFGEDASDITVVNSNVE